MSTAIDGLAALRGLRVLVVEDEELIAMLIEDFLLDLGCEVVGPAASVAAALALVEAGNLGGALLDMNLNGEPVYAVADGLAARGIPFIFTTGYAREDLVARHADAPTLVKPFSSKALQDTIVARFLPRVSG